MPGLYGYFSRREEDGAQVARCLERMLSCIALRQHQSEERFVDARLGLQVSRIVGSAGSGQTTVSAAGALPASSGVHLFLDGYLLDHAGLRRRLGIGAAPGRAALDDQGLARALLNMAGAEALEALEGSYNLCLYDPVSRYVRLISSRHGERHLYYRITPEYFAFATEMKALLVLEGGLRLDRLALQEMFNFGYLGRDRTLLRETRLLEGGIDLRVGAEGVRQRRYWDYPYANQYAGEGMRPDFDAMVDEGAAVLEATMSRQLARWSEPGIPLSGGLDSRTILAYAARGGRTLNVYHCAWYAAEQRSAQALAAAAGACWHVYDPLQFDAAAVLREGMDIADGNVHCHQFWFLPIVRQLAQQGQVDVLLDGYLMDVLLGDTFLVLPHGGDPSRAEQRAIINRLWRRCRPEFVRRAFLPRFYVEYEEANRSSIEAGCAALDEPHLSNFIQRFSLRHRSNRYSVALPNVQRQYIEYSYPGLDRAFIDFCLRVPPEYRAGGRLYRQILLRHQPQFAAIPWAKTGKPLQVDKSWLSRCLGRLPVRQLGTLALLRLSGGAVDVSHHGDLNRHFRHSPPFRAAYTEVLRDPRTWSRGIIDRRGVERLIGFVDRGWPVLALLQSLVTVELFHRRFLDG